MAKNRLRDVLKKKGPFESLEQEALLNILRTNDQFQNRFGRLFREFGLTLAQYNILRILRGEGKPLPSLEIANRLVQVVPAITGLIDRLEKAEMVRRKRCESDRRVVYVEITNRALVKLGQLDEPVKQLHQQMLGHLTRNELKELNRLMEKARESLGEDA